MLGVAVVVWLWVVVLICVLDNSLVVGGLCPRHPVPGGLRFQVIPRWVRAVFAMKHAVISARLLHSSPAPATRAIAAALGGDNLDDERLRRRGAGWLRYAPATDCGCPVRSLTVKALSIVAELSPPLEPFDPLTGPETKKALEIINMAEYIVEEVVNKLLNEVAEKILKED
jgi:hypothetical protein